MRWKEIELKELTEAIETWSPVNEIPSESFHYIDLSSIDKGNKEIVDEEVSFILGENAPSRAKQKIKEGDILLSTVRPNLNGVAVVTNPYTNGTASTGYSVLRVKSDKLQTNFLFYWVQSNSFIRDMIKKATGANYPAISNSIVKRSKIPLPPLPVQKKIAAILDAADDYRQKTKALIEKYDELTQSLFLDMFGDPVKNEKGWEVTTIRNVVKEVKYGTSSKASDIGQYPYLRMNNITYSGYMDFKKLKFIDVSDKDKHKYLVKKGDILFNRTNSKELVGKTGLITSDNEMIIAGYLIRVRVNKDMNPYFVWRHLNSIWGKLTLENMCKSIVGMANINAQELQNIVICKPDKLTQDSFAIRVQAIEAQKQQAEVSLTKAEELFQSLLQRAFKGGLVN